jgi:oleandomycin transport system ATP-binding protein
MNPLIEAEGLHKRFGNTQALDGVDLQAGEGMVLGLLGPNGAGKTTAVRALATLIKPDSGRATICGYDVVKDAVQVRRMIGLTGQYASVDEELTGTENLIMIGRLLDMSRRDAKARAAELLARFGLEDAAGRAARTYSGGMRRRLDLAAGLFGRPRVIFLDEPTTGLDPRARGGVWDTVRAMVSDGATVLLTTQYLDEADALADEIAVLDHGRVVAAGTSAELKTRIGGQSLVVRPVEARHLDPVAVIITGLTGVKPDLDREAGVVTAPLEDPALLSEVVRRLDLERIVAAELALRLPSLDEVFLALTGHVAEESIA